VLQTIHNFRFLQGFYRQNANRSQDEYGSSASFWNGGCHMDLVTIAIVGVIVVSYLVGSLTSSVETEQKLPHRY
jgi:hypothetical protein